MQPGFFASLWSQKSQAKSFKMNDSNKRQGKKRELSYNWLYVLLDYVRPSTLLAKHCYFLCFDRTTCKLVYDKAYDIFWRMLLVRGGGDDRTSPYALATTSWHICSKERPANSVNSPEIKRTIAKYMPFKFKFAELLSTSLTCEVLFVATYKNTIICVSHDVWKAESLGQLGNRVMHSF